jgi:hypothetical protein
LTFYENKILAIQDGPYHLPTTILKCARRIINSKIDPLFTFSGRKNFLKSSKEGFAIVIPIVESQWRIYSFVQTVQAQFASQQNVNKAREIFDIFISFSTKPVYKINFIQYYILV